MRITVLWGLLVLLCQDTLVSSHILGRPSSASDLAQLKVRTHVAPLLITQSCLLTILWKFSRATLNAKQNSFFFESSEKAFCYFIDFHLIKS